MDWCVNFPKESVLVLRPSLTKACGGNRNAAKFLSYLLYHASLSGERDEQRALITVYRTQGVIVEDLDGEMSVRTLRDDAIPCLEELRYLSLEEFKGAEQYTAYHIYPANIQHGIDHPAQIPSHKSMGYRAGTKVKHATHTGENASQGQPKRGIQRINEIIGRVSRSKSNKQQQQAEQKPIKSTPKAVIRQQISRSIQLQTMPYGEYLQTPEWQQKRETSLRLAEYRCQVCNDVKDLNVHHRTYERRGKEAMSDLIALCGSCHEIFHQNGQLAQE